MRFGALQALCLLLHLNVANLREQHEATISFRSDLLHVFCGSCQAGGDDFVVFACCCFQRLELLCIKSGIGVVNGLLEALGA